MAISSEWLSLGVEVFGLPITTLALIIGFQQGLYDKIHNYCDGLVDLVTAEIEGADDVKPPDVHDWSSTLRYAYIYRKSCNSVIPIGFASIVSWLGSIILSRINPLGLGSWNLPLIRATSSTMAAIFSFGLFAILMSIVGALVYIEYTRADTMELTQADSMETAKSASVSDKDSDITE